MIGKIISADNLKEMRADLGQYLKDIVEPMRKDISAGWEVYPFVESYLEADESLIEEVIVQFEHCDLDALSRIMATLILRYRPYKPTYDFLISIGKKHDTLQFLYPGTKELMRLGLILGPEK